MMDIESFLSRQLTLQKNMQRVNPEAGTKNPYDMSFPELEQFIHWNFMALVKELSEATDEISWKPWASGQFVNYPACIHEMVDAWHFFMNIMLAMGAMAGHQVPELAQEFSDYYQTKNAKNLQRQIDGYDGVSTKCPVCHRELSEVPESQHYAVRGRKFCSTVCVMNAPEAILNQGEEMDKDPELVELQADIERRSGSGATPSAEDVAEAAKEAHRQAQQAVQAHIRQEDTGSGATTPFRFSGPPPIFQDPADKFSDMATVSQEIAELDQALEELISRQLDKAVNPHAMKMVWEAEKTGEPLFCFRARDFFSIQVLATYANIVEEYGPDNALFHNNIVDAIGEFKEWQRENMGQVRYPD